jgi:hypothetical protein
VAAQRCRLIGRRQPDLQRLRRVDHGRASGLKWSKLSFDPAKLQQDFVNEVVAPVRSLAGKTIDAEAIILGLALPGRSATMP